MAKVKKDVFALVCVNEESKVVSVSLHKTQDEAHAQMSKEYSREIQNCDNITNGFVNETYSLLEYDKAYTYEWTIKKTKEA